MRCELSPHKCSCPHLIPDSPSLVFVHSLPSAVAGSYLSVPLSCLRVRLLHKSLSGFLFLPLHPYLNLYCLMFPVIGVSSFPFLSLLSSVMYWDRRDWEAFGQWESTDISLFVHSSNLEVPSFFSSTADVILQQDSLFHRFFSLSPILIPWSLAPWI